MLNHFRELFKVSSDVKRIWFILHKNCGIADVIVVEIISFIYVQCGCLYYGCRNTFYINTELSRELCHTHLKEHIRRRQNNNKIYFIELDNYTVSPLRRQPITSINKVNKKRYHKKRYPKKISRKSIRRGNKRYPKKISRKSIRRGNKR